jgi:CHAD domain-containing protein
VRYYNKFFSGLGKLTNPVRDFDVFLLKLDNYQSNLGKSSRERLQPLRQYLMDKRSEAQKTYVENVKSSPYRQTVREWREYLLNPDPVNPPLENTQKPARRLADELIWETYRLALKEGNAITDDTEAEALHELRKTCKKLRYLMEFFQSLYPAKKIRELIKALKELQDNLGDFNDYHVHIEILKGFKKSCTDENAVKACKKLINSLRKKQHTTRNSFAERFAAFSQQDNQNEFRELFAESLQG